MLLSLTTELEAGINQNGALFYLKGSPFDPFVWLGQFVPIFSTANRANFISSDIKFKVVCFSGNAR